MKKIISFLITIALVFSLTACGGNGGVQNAESGAEAQNASASTETAQFQRVSLGDTISLDFVELALKEVCYGDKLATPQNSALRRPKNEANRLFWLSCVLKNLMGESFSVDAIKAKMVFDGKYAYECHADSSDWDMAPLVQNNVYIYGEVPLELLENYQSMAFQFGFNDNFERDNSFSISLSADGELEMKTEELSDLKNLYELACSREEVRGAGESAAQANETGDTLSVEEESANAQETASKTLYLGFGDTVKTNGYEFTLNKVKLSYQVLPDDTSGFYSYYTPDSGNVYIDIDASIKNLMKRDIMIRELFTAEAVYGDGYTYNGSIAVVYDGSMFHYVGNYSAAAPLQTCHAHYMIQCPQEVEDSLKSLYVVIHLADGNAYRYYIR